MTTINRRGHLSPELEPRTAGSSPSWRQVTPRGHQRTLGLLPKRVAYLFADAAIDQLPQQISVADMSSVFRNHVVVDPT